MDFEPSPKVRELRDRIAEFIDRHIHPAETAIAAEADLIRPGVPYPPALVPLRKRAKAEGLWNLFLPDEEYGAGLKNWEYGILCELMGRSLAAPAAFNCSAPDTGNIEILAEFGTPEQKKRWLEPLLEGEIRSCFSMTEPEVAGSDPTLLRTRAVRDGDHWVINGHKWFTSGAIGASVAIVMTVTDPEAQPHLRASMIIVPIDNPGLNIVRPVPVMGHTGGGGHCEIRYEDCRVPAANLLGPVGGGEGDLDDQGGGRQRLHERARPRDPGARRARRLGRHAARAHVARRPHAPPRRRPRRGAQADHRPPRAGAVRMKFGLQVGFPD